MVRLSAAGTAGRLSRSCTLMVLLLTVTGCGPYTGSVSGTVTFKGKPLPGGMVTFSHSDGRFSYGKIAGDGSYSTPNAPAGEVKIGVATQPPLIPGSKVGPLGPYVPIPIRYKDAETSGLTFTIQRGEQTHNINLEDK